MIETRQEQITHIKQIIRRHPRWATMRAHRLMLCRMIRRARGQNVQSDHAALPFWPDLDRIKHKRETGKAAE